MSTFPDRIANVDSNAAADINILAAAYPQYRSDRTYELNAWITDIGIQYLSLQASNLGNTPASSPTFWASLSSISSFSWAAGGFYFPATNPAPLDTDTGTNGVILRHLFDDTTEEFFQQQFVMPSTLNTGTVVFEAYGYSVTAAASKNIKLKFYHSAKSSGESWDAALSSVSSADLAVDSTQDRLDRFAWNETVATLGWTVSEHTRIQVSRIAPSGPNLAGDWGLTHFRILLP